MEETKEPEHKKLRRTERAEETKEPEHRKLWRIGKRAGEGKGSYVVTLPSDWAEKVGNQKIIVTDYKGSLLLTPMTLRHEPKIFRLKIDHKQKPSLLKYRIISAYLNNFREFYIKFTEPNNACEDMLETLHVKLLGLSVSYTGEENERLVSMSTMVKPIPSVLSTMLLQSQAIHKINQEVFLTKETSEYKEGQVESYENEIDRNSFLIKRLFCVASEQPEMMTTLGIGSLSEIVHWENLNSNLERVADLQREIYHDLKRLLAKDKPENRQILLEEKDYGFRAYHEDAQRMVNEAYSKDLTKIGHILDTKRTENEEETVKYRGEYITYKHGTIIENLVKQKPELLMCMHVRIFGLTGCATNIAEAWLNMQGPSISEEAKS